MIKLINYLLKKELYNGFFTYDYLKSDDGNSDEDIITVTVVITNPYQKDGKYTPFITRGEWKREKIKEVKPEIYIDELVRESDLYARNQMLKLEKENKWHT